MSVEIWTNIRDAIREVGLPETAKLFEQCRDRNAICDFLNEFFSIGPERDWHNAVMTQVPDMLRKEFHHDVPNKEADK